MLVFFFQAEDGIRDFCLCRGLGDVYKVQVWGMIGRVCVFVDVGCGLWWVWLVVGVSDLAAAGVDFF
mgnify:FL=1